MMSALSCWFRRCPCRLVLLAAIAASLPAGCSGGNDLSGTYEAKAPEGTMTIEFKSDKKARMTMAEAGGQPQVSEGAYLIDGNKVTLQFPGGLPMILTRDGNTLACDLMGQILTFKKK